VAEVSDEVVVLAYVDTPERLEAWLAANRGALGPKTPLGLSLRPLQPDCDGAAVLAAKVALARRAGVRRLDFNHYAMMPLRPLDWIRAALAGGPERETS
jgi:hypothetical protein